MALTNYNQIPGVPVAGGDVSCFNNAATAIPAGSAVVVDASYVPTGDHVMGVKLQTGSGSIEQPAGITVDILPAGKYGRVRKLGAAPCTASGTVTVGDFLMIDGATGNEGQVATQTSTHAQIGRALNSGVDLDIIQVDVAIARNA